MIKNTYAGNRTENVTGTPDACKIHKTNSKKPLTYIIIRISTNSLNKIKLL